MRRTGFSIAGNRVAVAQGSAVLGWAGAHPPQQGADPRDQLAGIEGLPQVVIGADLEPQDAVEHLLPRAHHQDGHVDGAAAQFPAHPQAVHARQAHVQQDQVEAGPGGFVQGGGAVRHPVDLEPLPLQAEPDHLGDVRVVLGDQEPRIRHGLALRSRPRRTLEGNPARGREPRRDSSGAEDPHADASRGGLEGR